MKNIVKMSIIVVVISIFCLNVSANVADDYIDKYEEILPDEFSDVPSMLKDGGMDFNGLLEQLAQIFTGKIPDCIAFLSSLLGITLLTGCAVFLSDKIRGCVLTSLSVISALYIGCAVSGVFAELNFAASEAGDFFSSVIPTLSAIILAGGGVKGAAAQAAGMNIVLSVVGGGLGTALSLFSGFSLAMGLASSIGTISSADLNRFSKNLFMWIFGIATALLMGMLSLQTFVSTSSDGAAMKMAKYMASGYLPLVGGTVSSSLSVLAAGLGYAKGIIGASSIIVLIFLLLSPLALALLYRLSLSVASGFAALLGISSAEKTFLCFRSSFDILIGVYSLCGILYVFEIILFLKSGVAIG